MSSIYKNYPANSNAYLPSLNGMFDATAWGGRLIFGWLQG
jgi:hypothetical protein